MSATKKWDLSIASTYIHWISAHGANAFSVASTFEEFEYILLEYILNPSCMTTLQQILWWNAELLVQSNLDQTTPFVLIKRLFCCIDFLEYSNMPRLNCLYLLQPPQTMLRFHHRSWRNSLARSGRTTCESHSFHCMTVPSTFEGDELKIKTSRLCLIMSSCRSSDAVLVYCRKAISLHCWRIDMDI